MPATPLPRLSTPPVCASSAAAFKYHRPRGVLCFSGKCPNCLMNVDGIPNVRTCV